MGLAVVTDGINLSHGMWNLPAPGIKPMSLALALPPEHQGSLTTRRFAPLDDDDIQSLICVQLFATPWTAACQASLSFTIFRSLLKLMSIESVMPSSHLVLCFPLFLLPSFFPSIRVFSSESALHIRWPKYWSFSFNIITSAVNIISWKKSTKNVFSYSFNKQGIIVSGSVALGCQLM